MLRLGADWLINYKNEADFSKLVMEYTKGSGADIIVDPVGAQNFHYVRLLGFIHVRVECGKHSFGWEMGVLWVDGRHTDRKLQSRIVVQEKSYYHIYYSQKP